MSLVVHEGEISFFSFGLAKGIYHLGWKGKLSARQTEQMVFLLPRFIHVFGIVFLSLFLWMFYINREGRSV